MPSGQGGAEPHDEYELARWRGRVDATLGDQGRRLNGINGHVEELLAAVTDLRVSASRFAVLFALAVSVASILGSAVGALVVYQLTNGGR
jgi:hypothetical protein